MILVEVDAVERVVVVVDVVLVLLVVD